MNRDELIGQIAWKLEKLYVSGQKEPDHHYMSFNEYAAKIIDLCQPQWASVDKDKLKELAENYAHCYSFVGDDSMPIARQKLYDAIDSLPSPPVEDKDNG